MFHLLLALLILPGLAFAADKPRLLASVGPLQLIANEIIGEGNSVELLIDDNASPHHFQLKPSHLRKVGKTDLLIWISNDFETALGRLQDKLPKHSLRLQLASHLPATQLIGSGHDLDGHVWLSAKNVKRIGELIAQYLSRLDETNRALYEANASRLSAAMDDWLQQKLEQFAERNPAYITNHGFLAYFEQDLGLKSIGSLRNSHDHGGRLRSLSHLHHHLHEHPAKCLLIDRFPASRQVRQIAEQYDIPVKLVNILGGSSEFASIVDVFEHISQILLHCH